MGGKGGGAASVAEREGVARSAAAPWGGIVAPTAACDKCSANLGGRGFAAEANDASEAAAGRRHG